MSKEVLNCYMTSEIVEALECEPEDIIIHWIQTSDGVWQLCIQCDQCGAWLRYPWVNHPCVELETLKEEVETAEVLTTIETSVKKLTEGLV